MAEEEDNTQTVITKPGVLAFGSGLLRLPAGLNITTFFQDEIVVQLSCGYGHSAAVCESGRVYIFGEKQDDRPSWMEDQLSGPRLFDTLGAVRITQTACGVMYRLFLTDKGELYSSGGNYTGQLGRPQNKLPTPVLVTGLPSIKKITAAMNHTVVLADSGEVWVCGSNSCGQLGLGHTNEQTSFTKVPNLPESIVDISCGAHHTGLITASQVLLMSGMNVFGQLGLGSGENLTSFKAVSTAIAAVSCGFHHTAGLRVDGTVWTCGRNSDGQLGTGSKGDAHNRKTPTTVVGLEGQTVYQVIAGSGNTAILTQEGDVWVCGRGIHGQLGPGKKDLLKATMLTKSPGLVVKQMAFEWAYSLLLVVPSSIKTPASQLQIGATEEGDAPNGCITNLERSIMRSLECPVCMTIMCAPIHQCAKGHSVCAECWFVAPACPLCSDRMIEARNFPLESLSKDARLPCSMCLRRIPASEINGHFEICPRRSYGCPVDGRCGWMGRPPAMLAHATQTHAGSTWARLPHMFVQTATADVLLAAHGQVFTLHRRYEAGERFRAAVRYIGLPENAYNYQLELTVMTDSMKNTFHRIVCSDIENIDDIFQSSNCVTLESDVVKTFLQRGRLLCRVAILEAGSRHLTDQVKAFRSLHD